MKTAMLVTAFLFAAACGGKATPAPVAPVAPPTPAEVVEQVKRQVEQYRQGYEVRSVEALAPLYAQTDDLVVVVQGRPITGWSAVHDALASFCARMQTVKVRVHDLRVVGLGDAGAVASATVRRTYGDGVQTIDESGALTLVFRRGDDGVWRIVAEHYSFAPVVQ